MQHADTGSKRDTITEHLYGQTSRSLNSDALDLAGLSERERAQVGELMRALVELREAEQAVLAASEKYMRLSTQDMRAIHYLIAAKKIHEIVTPSMIAAHLKISAASTTKLLNRLEKSGHLVRSMHPVDRRAFSIEVTPQTEATAQQTVGQQHAKRLNAALRLSHAERDTVIEFLRDMAQEMSVANADWAAQGR